MRMAKKKVLPREKPTPVATPPHLQVFGWLAGKKPVPHQVEDNKK
ncbi:hypothetical protein MCEMSE15_01722 [Fimbriimonadaceae bacterium]